MRPVPLLALAVLLTLPGGAPAQGGPYASLAREIRFAGVADPKATLADAIGHLGEAHKIPIIVNHAAFKAERFDDILQVPVAQPPLRGETLQAYYILQRVIRRIPNPSGAALIVRGDAIEITTTAAARTEKGRPEPPPGPSQAALDRLRQARAFLRGPIDFPGLDDVRITLAQALDLLAKEHGLVFEVNEQAFLGEQVADVLFTEVAQPTPLPVMKNATGEQILVKILARIPAPSGAGFVVRPGGFIEVTTTNAILGR